MLAITWQPNEMHKDWALPPIEHGGTRTPDRNCNDRNSRNVARNIGHNL
jgi:hypothetical protein